MSLAAVALLCAVSGYAYFCLVGLAAMVFVLPRRWFRLAPMLAPLYGWAVTVAFGYPLNAALPFQWVIFILAGASVVSICLRQRQVNIGWRVLSRSSTWWENVPVLVLGVVVYLTSLWVYLSRGAVSALVVDSDIEHFADTVAALTHFPIGWSLAAQQGLEATPIGLAYHYVHAVLAVLSGSDAFAAAIPAQLFMLSLAPGAVYVFVRSGLGGSSPGSLVGAILFSLSGLPLGIASFGWGQQTAAIAAVPAGCAAIDLAFRRRHWRTVVSSGLLTSLAAGSLYLATAPLVGGTATLAALLAAGSRAGRLGAPRMWSASPRGQLSPAVVLVGLGTIVLVAGGLSHLSAAAFVLGRGDTSVLRADDLAGRSTHVSTFVSLPAFVGVEPWDLFRDAERVSGERLLNWAPPGGRLTVAAASAAAVLLWILGLARVIRRQLRLVVLLALLGTSAAFFVYLRILRPFPYGEFKLLTVLWFLVPSLIALGLSGGWTQRFGGKVLPTARMMWLRSVLAATGALYVAALLASRMHLVALLWSPWGAALPDAEVRQIPAVVASIPRGATVWVSNSLTPLEARDWSGQAVSHRAGFASRAAGMDYLARRWRGIVVHQLAFGGRVPAGTVQRHSAELRNPVDPRSVDYVLLDEREDARFFGLLEQDLVVSAGTLRLYRQPDRPSVDLIHVDSGGSSTVEVNVSKDANLREGGSSRATRGGTGESKAEHVSSLLPIGPSMPGRRVQRETFVPARMQPRQGSSGSSGSVVLGLFSPLPVEVEVHWEASGEIGSRRLLLGPGVTWYTSPSVEWPARIRVQSRSADSSVRPLMAFLVGTPGPKSRAESIERSSAGTDTPLLLLRTEREGRDVWLAASYADLTGSARTTAARLRSAAELWEAGATYPVLLQAQAGTHEWRVKLTPEAPSAAGESAVMQLLAPWAPSGQSLWLWLQIGAHGDSSLHEHAWVQVARSSEGWNVVGRGGWAHTLPLLGSSRPTPAIADGMLVKGTGDHLFYVARGRLRWVPELAALERHGVPWRLTVLDDVDLWRLPPGFPLD